VKPEPLKLVPELPLPSPLFGGPKRGRGGEVSWYEAQDLVVIQAQNNEIAELQPEISLFGSLKTIDVRKDFIFSSSYI
jgi:hypothetical protein